MTIQNLVRQARSFNKSGVLALKMGGLSATASMCFARRDYLMSLAKR